jgi:hypothetical protein
VGSNLLLRIAKNFPAHVPYVLTSVPALAFSSLVCRFLAIFAFNLKIGGALVMLSVPGLKALSLQIQFLHFKAIF